MTKALRITELAFRDAHQSLLATRMRIEDILPIAPKLDQIGFWSVESWGGATFDACIRYLGEDPWERLRRIKQAMPRTPQQMLLRGQNLLGYRHYADDVVKAFVERAAVNGVDIFRIFDALNDVRNLETAVKATLDCGKHAQGTICYTVSPVHTMDKWVEMGKRLEHLGCHSIAIKDMAGLLRPYVAEELVSRLKDACDIPIALHSHATTGMSTATCIKAVEAGVDMLDTATSALSMTYGHSATESIVAILQGTERDTGLDLGALKDIAAYFREVRRKYAQFEGSLKGVDARILVAQVPGGMLTNMEQQLRDQGASDAFDTVLEEIPRVRKDLGYIPLVTPTSQIVGTQAVLNVLLGQRYKNITKETQGILKGEYGATPVPVDEALQSRVLGDEQALSCRPADLIEPEMDRLAGALQQLGDENGFEARGIDDVLTYALFPLIGAKFLQHRGDAGAFEPPPGDAPAPTAADRNTAADPAPPGNEAHERYKVTVNGRDYDVEVTATGTVSEIASAPFAGAATRPRAIGNGNGAGRANGANGANGAKLPAPLSGTIFRVLVEPGQHIEAGEILLVLEAMKMETEIRAPRAGVVSEVFVDVGDNVDLGHALVSIG